MTSPLNALGVGLNGRWADGSWIPSASGAASRWNAGRVSRWEGV